MDPSIVYNWYKVTGNGVAAIAQWICCTYHPEAPGSSPKHNVYAFFKLIFELCVTRTKIKQKGGWDRPIGWDGF